MNIEEKRAYNRAYMREHRKKYKRRDREYMRAYYQRNREKIRAYQREYRERMKKADKPKRKQISESRQRSLSLLFLRKEDRKNFKWLCERMKNKRKKSEERGNASGCVKS